MQQNRCTTYYSLFHSDVRLYFTHGNFLTDPRGNISHWRGIRGTRKRKKRGGGRSDSTHVTIINSDCSMGMCIYSRANGEVFSNACAPYAAPLSVDPPPLTDTNNVHEDAASCLFEAASGNRRWKFAQTMLYVYVYIPDKSRPVLPAIRSRIRPFENWKS